MEEKKKDDVKKEQPKTESSKKFEVVKNPEPKKKNDKKTENNKKYDRKFIANKKIEKKVVKQEPKKKETSFEIPSQENKDYKPKFQKVQQTTKRKSGGKKGLVFFVFLLIIAGVVVAWFNIPEFRNLFKQNNQSSTTSNQENNKLEEAEEWEKAYVKVLAENYNYEEIKDFKIQLITINEEDKIPALVTSYTNLNGKAEKLFDMWQANEKGEIESKVEKCDTCKDVLKVLYSVKDEKYGWYLYLENENQKAYGSLSRLLKDTKKYNYNENHTKYNLFDYVVSKNSNLANISEEKFENQFIVVEKESLLKTWVEYKKDTTKNDALGLIKKEYSKKKTAREVVSDNAKELILNKVEKLQKQEVTESLKYGTYSAKINENSESSVVLTSDRTCSYSGLAPDGSGKEIHSVGSYEVIGGTDTSLLSSDRIVLKLKDGNNFEFVIDNTSFKNSTVKFEYKNNETKLLESETTNNQVVIENNTNIINPVNQENSTKPENVVQVPTNTESQPTQTVNTADIGKEEALKLVQKVHETNSEGKKIGYYYLAWVKDVNDNKYYAFKVASLVDESRYTFVDTILISADGKSYKQIVTPENFTDGQIVTKFDSEKNF